MGSKASWLSTTEARDVVGIHGVGGVLVLSGSFVALWLLSPGCSTAALGSKGRRRLEGDQGAVQALVIDSQRDSLSC